MQLAAVFEQVPEGYIGFIEELPGVNTQGETLAEARANLVGAVELGPVNTCAMCANVMNQDAVQGPNGAVWLFQTSREERGNAPDSTVPFGLRQTGFLPKNPCKDTKSFVRNFCPLWHEMSRLGASP